MDGEMAMGVIRRRIGQMATTIGAQRTPCTVGVGYQL